QEMARPKSSAPWPMPQKGSEVPPRLKILTPQPVWAGEEEQRRNPRSRSARLRAAEKLRGGRD
ncbi:16S rRNA (cytosine(1402)-N(4))-methyltransferase, partial [Candidatus Sumerlaeota bacterium]|nr:16S rRNA (cytosine(1402)-N(4))-methyltransferase [Candidatus Sumerlaeota bacterium]